MAKKIDIEQAITPDIESLGYELEYVESVKEGQNNILRVVIDKPSGLLTTEDCETVSRKIEDKVDSLVKMEDGYILEVSSPGLERALKNIKLYRKYIGKEILVKLYKKLDGTKELTGKLLGVSDDDTTIELEIDGNVLSLKLAEIASANTIYNFEKECL